MNRTASKITDMTEGNPVRIILAFALPLFIGNIFQQIYSLADTMIAGHFLGDGAIAAIGATSVLYSLLMNLAWGLNNGYCIILSRIFGGGPCPVGRIPRRRRYRAGHLVHLRGVSGGVLCHCRTSARKKAFLPKKRRL